MDVTTGFFNYLAHEKRYSAHTIVAYQKDIELFVGYLKKVERYHSLLKVHRDDIRLFVVSLVEDGMQPRTIARKISCLKSFYKYALRTGEIKQLPTNDVSIPKISRSLPNYIPEHEITKLLTGNYFPDTFEGARDKLIIELLYGTGLRASEIMNLTEQNISFAESQIKVLGKRNKERIIPLNLECIEQIKRYLQYKSELPKKTDSTYLLLTKTGTKIYHTLLYKIVKYYVSLVSKNEKRSPHVLRHTFATHMLNHGASLNSIKELLGHASLSATQVYTHNSIEQLKNIHKQAHPRGEQKK